MNNAKVNQAWFLLRATYAIVPILIGLDKCFTGMLVNWNIYTSPLIAEYLPVLLVTHFVLITGIIGIIAGLVGWFKPRFGGYLVALWMVAIIIDLATLHNFYDIMANAFVIAVGALALAWLSEARHK